MTSARSLISMTECNKGSQDDRPEIRRITEEYTSKVNALIEGAREDLLKGVEAAYAEDLRMAGFVGTSNATAA